MSHQEKPLEEAIRIAGGQGALARLCGTSQPRIWQCLHRNRVIPADLVIPIELATGVARQRLRPDLYPPAEEHGLQMGMLSQRCGAHQPGKPSVNLSSIQNGQKFGPPEALV